MKDKKDSCLLLFLCLFPHCLMKICGFLHKGIYKLYKRKTRHKHSFSKYSIYSKKQAIP